MKDLFQPVTPNKASLQIIQQIRQLIESGMLSEGDRLPSERMLAQKFSTSRATIREALSALEIMGLTESKIGHGTFIRASSSLKYDKLIAELMKQTSPLEVMEARISLEPNLASMAAVRATQEDLEKMRYALNSGRESSTIQEFEHWDGQFHMVIAEAAKNQLLLRMTDITQSVRKEELWGSLKTRSLTPERKAIYLQDHEEIFQSIRDRNAALAKKLMMNHLVRIRKNLLGE